MQAVDDLLGNNSYTELRKAANDTSVWWTLRRECHTRAQWADHWTKPHTLHIIYNVHESESGKQSRAVAVRWIQLIGWCLKVVVVVKDEISKRCQRQISAGRWRSCSCCGDQQLCCQSHDRGLTYVRRHELDWLDVSQNVFSSILHWQSIAAWTHTRQFTWVSCVFRWLTDNPCIISSRRVVPGIYPGLIGGGEFPPKSLNFPP